MPPKNLDKDQYSKAEVAEMLRKQQEEVDDRIAAAELVAEMTDVEKAHYVTLEGTAKDEFLFMEKSQRAAVLRDAQDQDPVVYKAVDGTEYRKSAGEALIKMAKDRDNDRRELDDLKKAREEDRIAKMAETELQHLPGELSTRIALIKSVESIQDETERANAMAALKAQNAQMEQAFREHGTREGLHLVKGASAQLDQLAKKYAQDNPGTSYTDAYDQVSTANPELYAQAVNGQ